MSTTPKPIRFTAPVKRGLARVAQIARDASNPDKAPAQTVMARWPVAHVREYETALAWIDQQQTPVQAAPSA